MKTLNKRAKSGLLTVQRYGCGCGCLNIFWWTNDATTNYDTKTK